MKTSTVLFVKLVLFFGICAPHVMIGMKTDIPGLPPEVCKLILNKTLRLVLDEIEDDPHQLMAEEKVDSLREFFASYITGKALERYKSTNNIDYILRLIMAKDIGADPNTRNYKGNNVLHLLIVGALQIRYRDTREYVLKFLPGKIKPLLKYGLNLNAQNGAGNTVAHQLIAFYADTDYYYSSNDLVELITFLQNSGMSVTMAKNNDGHTAYETGQILNNKRTGLERLCVFPQVETALNLFLAQEQRNAIAKEINTLKK